MATGRNTEDVVFADAEADDWTDPAEVWLKDAQVGGNIIARQVMTNDIAAPVTGQGVVVRAGTFVITVNPTAFVPAAGAEAEH